MNHETRLDYIYHEQTLQQYDTMIYHEQTENAIIHNELLLTNRTCYNHHTKRNKTEKTYITHNLFGLDGSITWI